MQIANKLNYPQKNILRRSEAFMHADAQLATEALRAGASGFVVKHAAGKELIAAIHTVLRGGKYLPTHLASDVLTTLADGGTSGVRTLTPRQREVASLIAEGRTMKEVAAALRLSPRTVETHKYQIMLRGLCFSSFSSYRFG